MSGEQGVTYGTPMRADCCVVSDPASVPGMKKAPEEPFSDATPFQPLTGDMASEMAHLDPLSKFQHLCHS